MAFDPNLSTQGRSSLSYRVARGVMEVFVDSNTADRQMRRFFNDTDRGMSASAQRAARLFSLGFTRGIDGVIRDSAGRIVDPNDPRLQINSQRAGRRFWQNFHDQSQRVMGNMFRSTGFLSMFANLPPQFQAAIGMGLAGAIIGAGAFIGAALNAVLLAAVGGGIFAMGIASAFKNPLVGRAFQDVGDQFQGLFSDMGRPFVAPLIQAADQFETRVMTMRPEFRAMAAEMATLVKPFADGIDGLVEELMPGLRKAVSASMPVLKELAAGLPKIGAALSHMFESISSEGDGAVKGMRALIIVLAGAFMMLGEIIQFLSGQWDDLTLRVGKALDTLSKIPIIGKMFEGAAQEFADFNEMGTGFVRTIDGVSGSLGTNAEKTAEAARAAENLRKNWESLWNQAMSLDNALISYEESLDALTESVEENGRSLDIGGEKGRANAKALLQVAENAKQVRDAEIAAGGSVSAANGKMAAQVEQLKQMAYRLGLSKSEVDALLQKYYQYANAPNATKTITIRTVYVESGRPGRGPGTIYYNRWGGVLPAQTGLLTEANVFMAGREPLVSFAEPETEQEAFIPKRGNRARSMDILSVAADWVNADVVPRGTGGVPLPGGSVGAARGRYAAGGTTERAHRALGPYIIQVGGQAIVSMVVDAITGEPELIADTVDEGRRRRYFANPSISRGR